MKSIPFKNTEYTYGVIAILLHWIVAFAFILNYLIIYYKDWFVEEKSAQAKALFSYHTAIGVSVIVFVLLRIIWRLMDDSQMRCRAARWNTLLRMPHILCYMR